MILDFIVPFASILLAEFGDKTQLAVLSMSTKTKEYYSLFFGVLFAFILIDGLAVYFGSVLVNIIPMFWVKLISGGLFLFFGIYGLIGKDEEDDIAIDKKKLKSTFFSSFLIIFFAEMGDKSQIASALFGSIYLPILVFLGIILALAILSFVAIFIGRILIKKFDSNMIAKISNYFFIGIGLITLLSLV